MTVLGFGMFGFGGDFTDPEAVTFANRVRDEVGVDIRDSPYRYFQTDLIVQTINCSPADVKIILWGTSFGLGNVSVIASQVTKQITWAGGFQASQFGAKVGIPSNVLVFHQTFNPFIALGSYKLQLAEGNGTTQAMWTERWIPHPGDQDKLSQDMFLDQMKRVLTS